MFFRRDKVLTIKAPASQKLQKQVTSSEPKLLLQEVNFTKAPTECYHHRVKLCPCCGLSLATQLEKYHESLAHGSLAAHPDAHNMGPNMAKH